ncbi:hypothetical protein UZZ22_24930, partial [Escherichia coli]|nr:hypothetical protein [Escherichia coli]
DKVLPVEMPFSAVYYSDRAVSTRIRAFIDFLSEHVKTAFYDYCIEVTRRNFVKIFEEGKSLQ